MIKNIIKRLVSLILIFTLIIVSIKYDNKILAVNDSTDERYGITYANIDTFGYYEQKEPSDTRRPEDVPHTELWHQFGAGLDVKWRIPAEAKEGDYFTLKFGDKLRLHKAPMYDENDNIDYRNLDNVPNRYPISITNNYSNPNLFFVIYSKDTHEPILNVYYTKLGELTFVVQKYANTRGTLEGTAIIGDRIDPDNVLAITDKEGRHVRKKVYGDELDEKEDLNDILTRRAFYTGFEPNHIYLRYNPSYDQNTPQDSENWEHRDKYFVWKNLTYTTSYMGKNEVPLVDGYDSTNNIGKQGIAINYKTFLLKYWNKDGYSGGLPKARTSFGRISLFPAYEDRSFIYYYLFYQANKGETVLNGEKEIKIKGEDGNLDIEDIQTFEATIDNKGWSSVPSMKTFPENFTPRRRVGTIPQDQDFKRTNVPGEWIRSIPNGSYDYYTDENGKQQWKYRQQTTYFSIVTARKIAPIYNNKPENKPKFAIGMQTDNGYGTFTDITHNDYYVITHGFGDAVAEVNEFNDVDVLKLAKVGSLGNLVNSKVEKINGKPKLKDAYGNTYTETREGVYTDQLNKEIEQKRDNGKLVFLDADGNEVLKNIENGNTVFVSKNTNTRYVQDAEDPDKYVSSDGKIFKPYRPLLILNNMTLNVNISGSGSVSERNYTITDEFGNELKKVHKINNTAFDVESRYGNQLVVGIENDMSAGFYYRDTQSRYIKYDQDRIGNRYHLKNMNIPILVTPVFSDSIEFEAIDLNTNVVFRNTVDEYGYVTFKSLIRGHRYELKELRTRSGYEKFENTFLVDVPKNSAEHLTITDKDTGIQVDENTRPIYRNSNSLIYSAENESKFKFKLVKVDAETGEIIVPNRTQPVRITIEKEDGTVLQNAQLFNGTYISLTKFSSGVYYLKEHNAPPGYELLSERIKLTIKDGGIATVESNQSNLVSITPAGDSDTIEIKVKNSKENRRFNLHIKKRDKEEVEKLERESTTNSNINLNNSDTYDGNLRKLVATFRLERKISNQGQPDRYENIELPNGGVTNRDNGYLSISNLTQGEYKLTETQAPGGYNLTSPIIFTVTKNGVEVPQGQNNSRVFFHNDNSSNELVVVAKNEARKFPIAIRKLKGNNQGTITDEDLRSSTNTLSGVRLRLRAKDSNTKNPEFSDFAWHTDANRYGGRVESDGSLTWNSSATGDAIFNLTAGRYILSEVSTVAGFKLSPEIEFVVKDDGNVRIISGSNELIELTQSGVVVSKVGEKDNRKAVALANYFEIFLRVTKKALEDNRNLQNARFDLFTNENATAESKVAESTATGSDGRARFKIPGSATDYPLKPGTYYLKERIAPNGYYLNSKIYQINISEEGVVTSPNSDEYFSIGSIGNDRNNGGDYRVLDVTLKNKKIFDMTFQKIDSSKKGELDANLENKNKSVAEAKIKIKPKVNDGSSKIEFDNLNWHRNNMNGEVSQSDGGVIWKSKTNNVPGFKITPGIYVVEELEAPVGFEKFSPFEIHVDNNGVITIQNNSNPQGNVVVGRTGNRAIVQAVDEKNLFDITFQKINGLGLDRNTISTTTDNENKALEGAKIKISSKENDPTARIVFDDLNWHRNNMEGEEIQGENSVTSVVWKTKRRDKPGLRVKPGTYIVEELEAPLGYKKFETFELIVNRDGTLRLGNNPNGANIVLGQEEVNNGYGKKGRLMVNAINDFGYNFKIKKVNTNGDFVSGSRFALKTTPNKTSGQGIYEGQVANITTQDGFTFDIRGNGFKPGTYYLVEETTPNGYIGIEPLKIEITNNGTLRIADEAFTTNKKFKDVIVEKSDTENNLITFKVENKKKFNLHLKKRNKQEVDAFRESNNSSDYDDNFKKLVATFSLERKISAQGEEERFEVVENQGNVQTNSEGYLNINNLVEGNYRLIENEAPNGYKLLENPIEFTVNSQGVTVPEGQDNARIFFHNNNGNDLVVIAKNELKKYKFKVIKTDTSLNALEGSRFEIKLTDNPNRDQEVYNGQKANINRNGFTFENSDRNGFLPGIYYLVEVVVPNGYTGISPIKVEIKENGEIKVDEQVFAINNNNFEKVVVEKDENDVITFKVKNKKKYTLHLKKRDKKEVDDFRESNNSSDYDNNFEKLEATFTLYKKVIGQNGTEDYQIVSGQENRRTDDQGYFNIENLEEGIEYKLEETVAPNGYKVLTNPIRFKVNANNAIEILEGNDNARIFFHTNNGSDLVIIAKNEKEDEPMKLYIDKKNNEGNRITSGKLKIRLENANIFEKEGQKVDEKEFNLETDYDARGLKIEIPITLQNGTYILTEIQAPNGYVRTLKRYHIEINQETRVVKLVKIDNGEGTEETEQNIILFTDKNESGEKVEEAQQTINLLEIVNKKKEYPYTGGYGETVYIAVGMLLMGTASYFFRRRYNK